MLQDVTVKCECSNHFRETGLSATRFGKQIISPFMAKPVINAAKTLTRNQYFGKDFVKPILRELACEHFERKMIYAKKHGFEVPIVPWLKGPLAHLVDAARQENDLFDLMAMTLPKMAIFTRFVTLAMTAASRFTAGFMHQYAA